MSDTNYHHEFVPSRRGRCKALVGASKVAICGEKRFAFVHKKNKNWDTMIIFGVSSYLKGDGEPCCLVEQPCSWHTR